MDYVVIFYEKNNSSTIKTKTELMTTDQLFNFMNTNHSNNIDEDGHVVMNDLFVVYKIGECVLDFS